MARIISSRKKYVPVKDLVVYPSKTETIEVIPDDGFNGAHRYRARSDDNGYMVVVLQHNATPPGTLKIYKELSRWSRLEESITLSND